MKRVNYLIVILILGLTFAFTGCGKDTISQNGSKDNSMEYIKNKGKFIVGLDDSFPPMGFRESNGELVGFDIDLAKETAKRMGIEVEFKPVDWDGVVMSLKNKDIDVIWNGLTITEKRLQQIDFTEAYIKNNQVLVVPINSSIKSKNDLKGKVLGVQMGSSSEDALNKYEDVVKNLKKLKKFSNNTEALMDLKAGNIDAVIIDEIVGRYYTTKKQGVYKVLDDNFGSEEYGVGYRKGEKAFGDELDKIIDEIKKDGTYDKIREKWFGK